MDHQALGELPFRVFFEEDEDALNAAKQLKSLGSPARKLLSDCIAESVVTRRQASPSAEALCKAGLLFIRDTGDVFFKEVKLSPSLAGEEALDLLEFLESTAPGKAYLKAASLKT